MRTNPTLPHAHRPRRDRSAHRPWADGLVATGPAWLLGIAPFVFLRIGGEFEDLPKLAFLQWGIGALALVALVRAARSRAAGAWPALIPLDLPVVLFPIALAASLAQAVNVAVALPLLLEWLAAVALYAVVSRTATETTISALFVAGAVGAFGVSSIGLAQAWAGLDWIPQAQPPAATFSNCNLASHHVAVALPLAAAWLAGGSRSMRWVLAVVSIVSLAYLWAAKGRAAWVALAVAVVIGVAGSFVASERGIRFRHRRVLLAVTALALVLAAVFVAIAAPWFLALDRPGTGGERAIGIVGTGTVSLRLIYWSNTLALARDHWLGGVGLGNFFIVYPPYHLAAAHDWTFGEEFQLVRAHNDHLQFLAELGVLGFCVWVAVLAVGAWTAAVVLERGDARARRQAVALAASIAGLVVIAVFDFPFARALPPVWLLAMLGALAALHRAVVPGREIARPTASTARALGLVLVCLMLAASLWLMPRRIRAEAAHARGAAALAAGQQEQGRAELLLARRLAPREPAIALRLAGYYADQKRYDEAVEALEAVLRAHPNHVNALVNLGWCKAEQQRLDDAERWLERALAVDPESMAALGNLGLVAMRRGDWAAAAERYERVLALAVDHREYGRGEKTAAHVAVAHLQLGRVRAEQGRLAEAIEHYEEGLRLRPELATVQAALDDLRRRVRAPQD